MVTDKKKLIYPEPIVIYMAIMATYAASVATLNYVRSHERPLPSHTRRAVLEEINYVYDLVRQLRLDVDTTRQIFSNGDFIRERTVRLGNGVLLTYEEFARYERVSANIFRTLAALHKACLKLERQALRHDGLDMTEPTNELGDAYELFDHLQVTRNLSVEEAWNGLDRFAQLIESACRRVRNQLYEG